MIGRWSVCSAGVGNAGYQSDMVRVAQRAAHGMDVSAAAVGPLVAQFAHVALCRISHVARAGWPLITVERRTAIHRKPILVDAVSNSIERVKKANVGPSLSTAAPVSVGAGR